MRKFSTALLFILAVSALAWFLPWLYAMAVPSASSEPFLAWSPVINQWVITKDNPTGTGKITVDEDGNQYNKNQRDELLPQLYYKDLAARNILPDSIGGTAIDLPALRHNEMVFTTSQRDINKVLPEIYLIMESMPQRADLEDPKEAFRADGRIEFINLADNKVNPKRGKYFTETFKARGFKFPIKFANAQITSRKQYDEGYLLVDSEGSLFHMKQQAGRPYMAKIDLGDRKAKYAFILENMNRKELGYVVTEDNRLLLLNHDGAYSVAEVPVGEVDPSKDRIVAMGNLFNRVYRVTSADGVKWFAVDNGQNLLGSMEFPREHSVTEKISGYIFPFTLSFISNYDSLARPRLGSYSFWALPFNCLLAICLFAIFRKKNQKCALAGAVITIFLGIYSFLTFYLLKKS